MLTNIEDHEQFMEHNQAAQRKAERDFNALRRRMERDFADQLVTVSPQPMYRGQPRKSTTVDPDSVQPWHARPSTSVDQPIYMVTGFKTDLAHLSVHLEIQLQDPAGYRALLPIHAGPGK